jgi:uncharacterized protein (TIGR03437 family)
MEQFLSPLPIRENKSVFRKGGSSGNHPGTNLTDAASVSFNGAAATFSVVSDSEIETTVPVGATTGTVTVLAATKTLKSSTTFRVTK